MKPIKSIFFLLAAALLPACSAPGDEEPEVIVPQDATLTVSVAPGSVLTKSGLKSTTGEGGDPLMKPGEDKINNIFAALFRREDSTLVSSAYVAYANVDGTTPDTIQVAAKSNTKYLYVVLVNVGKPAFTNMKELRELCMNLEDIRIDNQPMCSRFEEITDLKPGNNYIGPTDTFKDVPTEALYRNRTLPVYRTASRIDVDHINLDWLEGDADDLKTEGARFRLKRIYVVDAKSAARLADLTVTTDNGVRYSVEWNENDYKHGRAEGSDYLPALDLYTLTPYNEVILNPQETYSPPGDPWQCYVTENTGVKPTMVILNGDILHKNEDTPILSNRYYFVPLKDMTDKEGKPLSGIFRNYVIRLMIKITGRGSSDETYRENAKAVVSINVDKWAVETQKETDVN